MGIKGDPSPAADVKGAATREMESTLRDHVLGDAKNIDGSSWAAGAAQDGRDKTKARRRLRVLCQLCNTELAPKLRSSSIDLKSTVV